MPKINQEISAPAAVKSSSVPAPSPPPPWIELPGDVTANILQRLGTKEILNSARKVCTTWWKVCQDPAMWRVIDLDNPEYYEECSYKEKAHAMMCRCAVDRSQGQLVDLKIEHFGDEELINYIADRASNLKCLTLQECIQISGTSLTEAVKKLPKLEELRLTVMPLVLAGHVETIGLSCPNLKSFSCNGSWSPPPDDLFDTDEGHENEYAIAVATSMPQLQHLQLFGDSMLNEGLEAILDGCPLLESLDLRQCYYLDLEGYLGRRCREQVKDLKLPLDSTKGREMACCDGDYSDYEQYRRQCEAYYFSD